MIYIALFIIGALTLHTATYGVMLGLGAMPGVYYARQHLLKIEVARFHLYIYTLMFVSGIIMLIKAFTQNLSQNSPRAAGNFETGSSPEPVA
ncbi:MAG TPA: hypothetical protein VLN56_01075 [Gammaproteobacteria bacterium]|nr:hypothetical protein [Gammaproteobacteria bacterium]